MRRRDVAEKEAAEKDGASPAGPTRTQSAKEKVEEATTPQKAVYTAEQVKKCREIL